MSVVRHVAEFLKENRSLTTLTAKFYKCIFLRTIN